MNFAGLTLLHTDNRYHAHILSSHYFRPMPPQRTINNPFMSMFLGVPDKYVFDKDMSERECLNCNIFMPASAVGCLDEKQRLPVLVWLFGGGMRTGSNAIPLYGNDKHISTSLFNCCGTQEGVCLPKTMVC